MIDNIATFHTLESVAKTFVPEGAVHAVCRYDYFNRLV